MVYSTNQTLTSSRQVLPIEEFLETLPLTYRTIVALAYFTSSRISDVLSLKVKDIAPDQIIIHQSDLGKPKCVPILASLKPYLTVYLNGQKHNYSDLIFADKFGQPLKQSTVMKVLKLVAKQISLPELYLFVLC